MVWEVVWVKLSKVLHESQLKKTPMHGWLAPGMLWGNVCSLMQWSDVKVSVVSDSLRPHRLYSPWNSPGKNTGVGNRSLLQGIFPTQGSNPGVLHRRQILYQLSHQGSFSSVQFISVAQSRLTLWPHGLQHARLSCPSPTPRSLLKLMSIESVMPSNHLTFCHTLLLLPSISPSIRVFSNESVLRMRWPKY